MRTLTLMGCAWALVGCARAAEDGRTAWLQSTLVDDNRPWLLRDPAQVEGKLARMAASPYALFRGTAGQFVRDLSDGPQPPSSHYLTGAAARVPLVGDPHVENVGTFAPEAGGLLGFGSSDQLLVDFNDFDGASIGPYTGDVRRLALSVVVALATVDFWREAQGQPPTVDAAARQDAARLLVEAYVTTLEALAAGAPRPTLRQGGGSRIIDDLVVRARRDGLAHDELQRLTTDDAAVVAGSGESRLLLRGALDPVEPESQLLGVEPGTRRLVEALVAAYPRSLTHPARFGPGYFRIKDVARRLGSGVSSYPLLRWYVLVEGPSEASSDDVILELKEASDGVAYALPYYPFPRASSAAARVVSAQRSLQESSDNDALLGWAEALPLSVRVRHQTRFQNNLSVARIAAKLADGSWLQADLAALWPRLGALLASAHGASAADPQRRYAAVIHEALRGDGAGFVAETLAFVAGYAPVALGDRQRLAELLQRAGPRLGFVDPQLGAWGSP